VRPPSPRSTGAGAGSSTGGGAGSAVYFYRLYAREDTGRVSAAEVQGGKFARDLGAGDQLVSVPLEQEDWSLGTVLQTLPWSAARTYDAATGVWLSAVAAKPWNALAALDRSAALWVEVTADAWWVVAGIVPRSTAVPLRAGWNLIGSLSVPVDVADESSVQRMAEQVLSDPRGVQILVNFAGVTHRVDFDHLDSANWDRMVAIHLKGTYLCCQAFTQALREQGGAILNMSSMFGQEGRNDGAHYAAAKAGIMGLTRALAREMGKDQVRVNALAPGPVDTPITRGGLSEEEFRKKAEGWKSRILLGRIGVPEDLVGPSLFLVSDLSAWMTGVILPVDGGVLAQQSY